HVSRGEERRPARQRRLTQEASFTVGHQQGHQVGGPKTVDGLADERIVLLGPLPAKRPSSPRFEGPDRLEQKFPHILVAVGSREETEEQVGRAHIPPWSIKPTIDSNSLYHGRTAAIAD